ncbi:MAG: ribonuclease H-like domain-containing protein [Alicyclobacillus macrosporangiidus]|uniref:ribonuclease H-like domain-containing protein n=1 Tax=Alicyclobacillus macrosporangiidus TaxID=392015 RepID=UPI0026EEBA77|nr:ribonuclease H-like domain-containing protein [Alicyclobacillus macrosporangiidus]MCL6597256.1 ribonuclease H-like domain-containing protein [Alicyclobacillus macrosporangiidus]
MARSLLERLASLERSVGRRHPEAAPDGADCGDAAQAQAGDGGADAGEAEAGTAAPRLGGDTAGEAAAPSAAGTAPTEGPEAAVSREGLWALGFRPGDPSGGVWHRTLRYDLLTVHGRRQFADLARCDLSAAARALGVDELPPERLRFYDTETTGLGQGAGNVPFLHAVARIEGDELAVHQYFLADHAGEPDLLSALTADHFAPGSVVVTFNGKSFDWPLLQTRLALWRLPRVAAAHADLIHASRRLWRRRLGRVALADVEAGVLGIRRADDLPGREAPARYFAWLEDGRADWVEPVFEHNAADVCSLAVLLVVVADLLAGREAARGAEEWLALARWYDAWQAYDLAARCYTGAAASPDAGYEARWLKSLFHKRHGEWAEAAGIWLKLAEVYPHAVPPLVELAKHFEHRAGDFEAAARWAWEAWARASALARVADEEAARWREVADHLRHRIDRILRRQAAARRVSRSSGASPGTPAAAPAGAGSRTPPARPPR